MPEVQARYDYQDEEGILLYQVERLVAKDGRKSFRQRHPDGHGDWIYSMDGVRRVLYRLPQIIAAVAAGKPIVFVEGEKDVHSLEQHGIVATTVSGGAGKWRPEYAVPLRGANVTIIADADGPGRKHAATVARELMADG